ncbi:PDDEXK family nuclease [Lentibacillus cibarius]|uniref:DUF2726 domain-containing protein n=1 Tax=Lentibacillus cibarius TaxID=2583219 RepID=A0A5S3R7I6_9BACI|nr:hypothetical protein [Lentibacillus cibarius]TMN21873.1 hypothetical protein FFL34_06900 [Lentibacillus cibarius]
MYPKKFLEGSRCRWCTFEQRGEKQRKTTRDFQREVKMETGDEFEVISEYQGAHEPIQVKHRECGRIFELEAARNLLVFPRCRLCKNNESIGEKMVREFLQERSWDYQSQYRFYDCRDRYPLPFDFAVFNKNELAFLIEYDGHGHFRPVEIYGGEEEFKEVKRRDQMKTDYCKERNIHLLRIPYFEREDMAEIIDQFIEENELSME